jgi:pimeloyl-ACP methyl ester carboxylesterase
LIVLLHGFMDSPRTWDLMRPYLGDEPVLAPALPGHLGGPPLRGDLDLAGHVERVLDEAGVEQAHLVGNSLGGYIALVLATRGRAKTVVALAPAGGADHTETLVRQEQGVRLSDFTTRRLPERVAMSLSAAVRACDRAPLIANAREHGWPRDTTKVRCPVRVLWGTEDRLLPWPAAAERYRRSLDAEWIELDGVGHAPQLDIPLETAQLVLGFTTARIASSNGPSSSPFSR